MKKQLQKNGLVIYQKEEKKKVLRTGNITYDDNGFHPDYIPE